MQSDKELYNSLRAKRDGGETLKPAERAKLKELEKQLNGSRKPKKESSNKSELLEPANSEKSPKLVRFVHAERKATAKRMNELLTNTEEVKGAIGSLSLVSEDLLIRAAALMLADTPDKKLLKYMKQALMNN